MVLLLNLIIYSVVITTRMLLARYDSDCQNIHIFDLIVYVIRNTCNYMFMEGAGSATIK